MKQNSDGFIEALVGHNAVSAAPESLKLFGQFVGSWEWVGSDYPREGSPIPTRGTWTFEPVLNGRAIQDIFTCLAPEATGPHGPFVEYGTTVRIPVGVGAKWKSVWIGPLNQIVRIIEGRIDGREIVQEGVNERDELIKWIFSDITASSFRWRGEYSPDFGKTWILYEELDAKRVS